MTLATVAAVVGIGAGVNSIVQSNKNKPGSGGATDQATNAADPFGPKRAGYGAELDTQYNRIRGFDPNSITSNPEYQFQLSQGIGAIDKGAAASGMLGSGTRLLDLQKYGQGLASGFADKQFGREMSILQMLGQFSGATTGSMGGAANSIMAGQQSSQNGMNAGLGNIMSGLGGLSRTGMFSGGSGGYGGTSGGDGSMIWANSGYGP